MALIKLVLTSESSSHLKMVFFPLWGTLCNWEFSTEERVLLFNDERLLSGPVQVQGLF